MSEIDEDSSKVVSNSEKDSTSSGTQSQKQRQSNQLIARSIQQLATANENSVKTLAAAFREPRPGASHAAAETVTRTELNEKLDQIDERNHQQLKALEKRQKKRQNELLQMLQAVVGKKNEDKECK